LIVYLMWSHPPFTKSEVEKTLKEFGISTDWVEASLEALEIYSILAKTDRRYSFTYTEFAKLFEKRYEIDELVESSLQEVQQDNEHIQNERSPRL